MTIRVLRHPGTDAQDELELSEVSEPQDYAHTRDSVRGSGGSSARGDRKPCRRSCEHAGGRVGNKRSAAGEIVNVIGDTRSGTQPLTITTKVMRSHR